MRMLLEIDCFPTGFLDKNVVVRGTAYLAIYILVVLYSSGINLAYFDNIVA